MPLEEIVVFGRNGLEAFIRPAVNVVNEAEGTFFEFEKFNFVQFAPAGVAAIPVAACERRAGRAKYCLRLSLVIGADSLLGANADFYTARIRQRRHRAVLPSWPKIGMRPMYETHKQLPKYQERLRRFRDSAWFPPFLFVQYDQIQGKSNSTPLNRKLNVSPVALLSGTSISVAQVWPSQYEQSAWLRGGRSAGLTLD